MAIRARTLLFLSLASLPCLALAHNGRDGAPPPLKAWSRGMAQAKQQAQPRQDGASQVGKFIDIYQGIVVKVDPKTGVRSYVQVGDVAANPARARVSADANYGPGVDYWVDKEFQKGQTSAPAEPSYAYQEPTPQIASYDEGYYGGYIPYGYGGYGYGDGGGFGGRPGGGHGGGGRPGNGGGDNPPPPTGAIQHQPYQPSPPPGPYGGGVGSPPPYNDRGVGAPPPVSTFGGFRSRRG